MRISEIDLLASSGAELHKQMLEALKKDIEPEVPNKDCKYQCRKFIQTSNGILAFKIESTVRARKIRSMVLLEVDLFNNLDEMFDWANKHKIKLAQ